VITLPTSDEPLGSSASLFGARSLLIVQKKRLKNDSRPKHEEMNLILTALH
jgi:hypothetical protein